MLGLAVLSTFACSGTSGDRNIEVTPAFAAHVPRSIHVFPPTNRSSRGDAAATVQDLLVRSLSKRGYRVGHPADATLHTTIECFGRRLRAGSGEAQFVVLLHGKLYDNASGAEIWSADGSAYEEFDDDDDDRREAGLFSSIVDSLFEDAFDAILDGSTDFAEEAVDGLLGSLPVAPRS